MALILSVELKVEKKELNWKCLQLNAVIYYQSSLRKKVGEKEEEKNGAWRYHAFVIVIMGKKTGLLADPRRIIRAGPKTHG